MSACSVLWHSKEAHNSGSDTNLILGKCGNGISSVRLEMIIEQYCLSGLKIFAAQ